MALAATGKIGALLGESFKLLGPASVVGFGYVGYRDKVGQGQNPLLAGAKEIGLGAASLMLHPMAYAALAFGPGLARAGGAHVVNTYHNHLNYNRQMRTPFSHRFEHTDASARAQSYGLQQIGAAWGNSRMGSEAATFARRYGRQ